MCWYVVGVSFKVVVFLVYYDPLLPARSMHGGKKLICPKCPGKFFNSENHLNEHTRRVHVRNYTCDICGYAVSQKSRLQQHMLTTHLSNDEKPFKCDVCGKGFGRSRSLAEHKNIHTNKRPYKCQLCPADFNSSGTLGGHIRGTHKGQKRVKK